MDAQKWPYGSCFGAPELDFAVFLRVSLVSEGLNLRFTREFTGCFIGLVAWIHDSFVKLGVFYRFGSLDSRFTREFTGCFIGLVA